MVSTQVQCSHCLQLKILSFHVIYSLFIFQLLISYNLLILSIPFFSVWKLSSSALFTWKYVKYDKVKGKVNVYYHTNYTSWSYKLCLLSSMSLQVTVLINIVPLHIIAFHLQIPVCFFAIIYCKANVIYFRSYFYSSFSPISLLLKLSEQ